MGAICVKFDELLIDTVRADIKIQETRQVHKHLVIDEQMKDIGREGKKEKEIKASEDESE